MVIGSNDLEKNTIHHDEEKLLSVCVSFVPELKTQ